MSNFLFYFNLPFYLCKPEKFCKLVEQWFLTQLWFLCLIGMGSSFGNCRRSVTSLWYVYLLRKSTVKKTWNIISALVHLPINLENTSNLGPSAFKVGKILFSEAHIHSVLAKTIAQTEWYLREGTWREHLSSSFVNVPVNLCKVCGAHGLWIYARLRKILT